MLRFKHLALGISLVIILAVVVLVFSCSPLQPSATPTPSRQSEEPALNQPVNEEPANEQNSTDLSHLINKNPAEVDNSRLPITPTEELHVTGLAPKVETAEYRLVIDGLVDTPLTLTHKALMRYPTVTEIVLLICPGFFADNAEWTGVQVTTLLAEAGIKPEARQVAFYALDGYQRVLSLEEVQREGVFLAHTVNGKILPKEHGYPLRLVVKGMYGGQWVKWVNRIEVM